MPITVSNGKGLGYINRLSASAAPTLQTLTLSGSLQIGTATSGTITGATAGSTIDGNIPGITIDSANRTYSGTPTGTAGTISNGLVETLSGAIGSPKSTSVTVLAASVNVFLPTLSGQDPLWVGAAGLKLVSAYSGPICRIVNPTNQASTLDLYPVSGGQLLDVSGVAAFLGANTYGEIDRVYDQTGNGNHLESNTQATRPLFRLTNAYRGNYCITFGWLGNSNVSVTGILRSATGNFDRQNTTMVHVGMVMSAGRNPNYMTVGSTAGNQIMLSADQVTTGQATAYTIKVKGDTTQNMSGVAASSGGIARTTVRSNATNLKVWSNNVVRTLTAQSSVTMTGISIGRDPVNTTNNSVQDWASSIIYPALSDADVSTLHGVLDGLYDIWTDRTKKVNGLVHSWFDFNTQGVYMKSVFRNLEPRVSERVTYCTMAILGLTYTSAITNILAITSKYEASAVREVYILPTPYNDLNALASGLIIGAETAMYASYMSMVNTLNGLGSNVRVICEIDPVWVAAGWSGSAQDKADKATTQTAFSVLVRNGAGQTGANAYTVADVAANPSATVNSGDSEHMTETTIPFRGDTLLPVINAALA